MGQHPDEPRTPGWRPLPGEAPEPGHIGPVLDRALRLFGAPASAAGLEVIFERWSYVVGDTMAARTRPVHLDGECLVIGCDEPAVATHVRYLQGELLERLAQLSGERRLTRVEVRVDGGQRRPRPPRPAARPSRPRT